MKNLIIGAHVNAPTVPAMLDDIVAAEQAGIEIAWRTVGGISPDPFAIFAAATTRTERIIFGTSVLPTFPRHPLAAVQGALAIDQLAPGRMRLGVGPSHQQPIEEIWGIPFQRPLAHLREYLTIAKRALHDGQVQFQGELISADAQIAGPTAVPVMASALRPRAFRLCGELADGAITWVSPLPYVRDVATPALIEGAAKAGRDKPPMIVHQPLIVSEDHDAVVEAARRQYGRYQQRPYYSQMLQDAGYPEAAGDEFTPALADALVISGSEQQVADRIAAMPSFGADEIIADFVLLPDDPQPAVDRTRKLLGELATSN